MINFHVECIISIKIISFTDTVIDQFLKFYIKPGENGSLHS